MASRLTQLCQLVQWYEKKWSANTPLQALDGPTSDLESVLSHLITKQTKWYERVIWEALQAHFGTQGLSLIDQS